MEMNEKLPPNQHEISALPRWNIDHPGIIPENPKVNLENWLLIVDGEVENPLKFTWQDFLKLPSIENVSDFHCVEGWSVRNLKWYGVKFNTLIHIVKVKEAANYVLFKCSDGYTTSLNLEDLRKNNVILATKLNKKWLKVSLGGPLRLVIPFKYGYKSAMWIECIAFTKVKKLGYWEKRGYSDIADVWKNERVDH